VGPAAAVASALKRADSYQFRINYEPGTRALQILSANDLKTAGVSAITRALEHEREAGVTVRGHLRYVVLEAEEFQRLRDLDLELALQETRADVAAGRSVQESVDDHLARLDALAAERP
jgi:PHD/YefM family antitoxin component YafN of YafNO toxin-antitoxin module